MEPDRLTAWVLAHWGAPLSVVLSLFPARRWIIFSPRGEAVMNGTSTALGEVFRDADPEVLRRPVWYKHGRITRRTTICRQHTFMVATGGDDA